MYIQNTIVVYIFQERRALLLRTGPSDCDDWVMPRSVRFGAAAIVLSATLFGQSPASQPAPEHLTLNLWPQGAPGAMAKSAPEVDTTTGKDNLIAGKPVTRLGNVSVPTLTVYEPKGKSTGAAVVVFPGGGYHILAIDLEGTEVCDWLNSVGVTCVLVKYRVPDSGPYPKSSAALQDAQRALGIVRSHASEWHIDPWDFRPALTWPQRSVLTSNNDCTTPLTLRTRSTAVPISPSSSIPAIWRSRIKTLRQIQRFTLAIRPRPLFLFRQKTTRCMWRTPSLIFKL
jgi:hypothetical protein